MPGLPESIFPSAWKSGTDASRLLHRFGRSLGSLTLLISLGGSIALVGVGCSKSPPPVAEPRNSPVISITESNFEAEVVNGKRPVLLDFGAEWCQYCTMMDGTMQDLASKYEGRITVGKIDVDQSLRIAASMEVQGLPTFVIVASGEEVWRGSGLMEQQVLEEALDDVLRDLQDEG